MISTDAVNRLKSAFPSKLGKDIARVVTHLHNSKGTNLDLSPESFTVNVNNESLVIPERLYFEEVNPIVQMTLNPVQKDILNCLFTRHHDGHIRENSLKMIIKSQHAYIPAYVIRLIGEYVIEILQVVDQNLNLLNSEVYKTFIKANSEFYEVNKQRVISYWDCYYRKEKPNKGDYIGFKILNQLDNLSGCAGNNLKPPLIVNEHGSISFFRSGGQMTSYLEAIDVKNNEYVVYDSEGRLVELGVERIPKRHFKIERVIIKNVEPYPDHAEELAALLRNICLHYGDSKEFVANAVLPDLVSKCYEKALIR